MFKVQDKKSHNKKFPNNGKAKNSWLIGMIKCSHCGYSIQLNIQHNKTGTKTWKYLVDFGYSTIQGCVKRTLQTKLDEVEDAVYLAICDKMKSLEVARREDDEPDAESENLTAEILKYDDDIHKLMDRLPDADDVLFAYIQNASRNYTRRNPNLKASCKLKPENTKR